MKLSGQRQANISIICSTELSREYCLLALHSPRLVLQDQPETTASAGELMAFNGLTAEALTTRSRP